MLATDKQYAQLTIESELKMTACLLEYRACLITHENIQSERERER